MYLLNLGFQREFVVADSNLDYVIETKHKNEIFPWNIWKKILQNIYDYFKITRTSHPPRRPRKVPTKLLYVYGASQQKSSLKGGAFSTSSDQLVAAVATQNHTEIFPDGRKSLENQEHWAFVPSTFLKRWKVSFLIIKWHWEQGCILS